jgi:membrane protease YdiL (CAAX protease family)
VFLGFAGEILFGWLLWPSGIVIDATISVFLSAIIANVLCMRIYEHRGIAAIGLQGDRASFRNLLLGLLGGVGSAVLALTPPLVVGMAHLQPDPKSGASIGSFAFVSILLLIGASGEEILFRGFGFQILLRSIGPWATIIPVGLLFAFMHGANPHASWLGLLNTAGFGFLFGYAFLRSGDIWLPIGLHFGWNFTLPLFGVNVSGLTMRLTGFSMEWSAGTLWSGGEYGVEASILTSAVLLLVFVFLWRAPIRRQPSAMLDSTGDSTCVPG